MCIRDSSTRGTDLIAEIAEMFAVAGIETEIIAASVRNPMPVSYTHLFQILDENESQSRPCAGTGGRSSQ